MCNTRLEDRGEEAGAGNVKFLVIADAELSAQIQDDSALMVNVKRCAGTPFLRFARVV